MHDERDLSQVIEATFAVLTVPPWVPSDLQQNVNQPRSLGLTWNVLSEYR